MTVGGAVRLIVAGPVLLLLLSGAANAAPLAGAGGMVTDDFKYLIDNTQLDVQDIVTTPLYVADENSVLRSPRFYLTVAGVGALWGGSFALDQTLRSRLHNMSTSDADLLQNVSYGSVGASAALLYAYGFYSADARARQYVMTGG